MTNDGNSKQKKKRIPTPPQVPFIRDWEVAAMVGMCERTVRRESARPGSAFPKARQLSKGTKRWVRAEVHAWINKRINEAA